MEIYLIVSLFVAAGLGLIPANIAKNKGYSWGLWWFYGWMLFIVAIIHVSLIPDKNAQQTPINAGASMARVSGNPDILLERAFMFLEDGDWSSAKTYCESVLDQDPKRARAYLGKLMAELQIPTLDKLKNSPHPLAELDDYRNALRFADDSLRAVLTDANLQTAYDNAKQQMKTASSELEFNHVAELFSGISGFEDADKLREECIRRAEDCRKKESAAVEKANKAGNRTIIIIVAVGFAIVALAFLLAATS